MIYNGIDCCPFQKDSDKKLNIGIRNNAFIFAKINIFLNFT